MWLYVLDEISKYLITTLEIAENCTYLAFKQGHILLCVIHQTRVIEAIASLFVLKFLLIFAKFLETIGNFYKFDETKNDCKGTYQT